MSRAAGSEATRTDGDLEVSARGESIDAARPRACITAVLLDNVTLLLTTFPIISAQRPCAQRDKLVIGVL